MDFIYTMPTWSVIAIGLVVAAIAAAMAYALTNDGYGETYLISGFTFLCVGLLVIAIPMAMRESASYAIWCGQQGGHVATSDAVVSTGNGVGVATTTYCLSSDGRILDVQ
jgi:hypothetical protein